MAHDEDDDRLEGDIGPAPPSTRADRPDEAEALRRYEAEREERRRRVNAVSGRIALVLVALLLGFLAYDSVTTALEAARRGDPWLYPPAVVAALCLAGLAAVLVRAYRNRR